jgi:peroxiredoxin
MALLEVGDQAPDITARRRDGSTLTLASLRGRHVLVYFYPRDDTPGCTAEACGLNDNLTALTESGADRVEHVWPLVNSSSHEADVLEEVRRRGASGAVAR